MNVVIALVRKNLLDSRWLLAICASALFGLCWLFVRATHNAEARIASANAARAMGFLRGMGGEFVDFSSASIEMAYWKIPVFVLIYSIWAISRGSIAVAGELERGTMDLVMSRPVERSSFLGAQALTGLVGLFLMGSAMVLGCLVGARFNTLNSPPSVATLSKAALNLVAIGWAIYGYSFLLSTFDIVRWRPTLIASVATLGAYIAYVVSTIPSLDLNWLKHVSIFTAYDPVEAVVRGENLVFNAGVLGIIGLIGVVLGFIIFARRDLPAGS